MNYGGWIAVLLLVIVVISWGRGHKDGHDHAKKRMEAERERAFGTGMMLGSQLLAAHLIQHHGLDPETCGLLQFHEQVRVTQEMTDAVEQIISEHETPP